MFFRFPTAHLPNKKKWKIYNNVIYPISIVSSSSIAILFVFKKKAKKKLKEEDHIGAGGNKKKIVTKPIIIIEIQKNLYPKRQFNRWVDSIIIQAWFSVLLFSLTLFFFPKERKKKKRVRRIIHSSFKCAKTGYLSFGSIRLTIRESENLRKQRTKGFIIK